MCNNFFITLYSKIAHYHTAESFENRRLPYTKTNNDQLTLPVLNITLPFPNNTLPVPNKTLPFTTTEVPV